MVGVYANPLAPVLPGQVEYDHLGGLSADWVCRIRAGCDGIPQESGSKILGVTGTLLVPDSYRFNHAW